MTAAALLVVLLTGQSEPSALELRSWGAPGETRFNLTLSPGGRLEIVRETLPITSRGLTRQRFSKALRKDVSTHILEVARAAEDFSAGCDAVADGTSASMVVRNQGQEIRSTCTNAPDWPQGPRTRALLKAINAELPTDWWVY